MCLILQNTQIVVTMVQDFHKTENHEIRNRLFVVENLQVKFYRLNSGRHHPQKKMDTTLFSEQN